MLYYLKLLKLVSFLFFKDMPKTSEEKNMAKGDSQSEVSHEDRWMSARDIIITYNS